MTPYLSSLWLGLVTPLYARVGRKLVGSLRNPTLVSNDLALRTFAVRPRSVREVLARALVNEDLRVGDALDFWRVEFYEPPHRLRLCAEMRLPGRAWLEFEVSGDERRSTIRQTAIFDPVGLTGLLYWYGIYPLHQFVFAGMLRNLVRAAQSQDASRRREG